MFASCVNWSFNRWNLLDTSGTLCQEWGCLNSGFLAWCLGMVSKQLGYNRVSGKTNIWWPCIIGSTSGYPSGASRYPGSTSGQFGGPAGHPASISDNPAGTISHFGSTDGHPDGPPATHAAPRRNITVSSTSSVADAVRAALSLASHERTARKKTSKEAAENIWPNLPIPQQLLVEVAGENGVSSWLTSPPTTHQKATILVSTSSVTVQRCNMVKSWWHPRQLCLRVGIYHNPYADVSNWRLPNSAPQPNQRFWAKCSQMYWKTSSGSWRYYLSPVRICLARQLIRQMQPVLTSELVAFGLVLLYSCHKQNPG